MPSYLSGVFESVGQVSDLYIPRLSDTAAAFSVGISLTASGSVVLEKTTDNGLSWTTVGTYTTSGKTDLTAQDISAKYRLRVSTGPEASVKKLLTGPIFYAVIPTSFADRLALGAVQNGEIGSLAGFFKGATSPIAANYISFGGELVVFNSEYITFTEA